jgi:outer membrane protein OmpA-like peptidoglycan-associated protein
MLEDLPMYSRLPAAVRNIFLAARNTLLIAASVGAFTISSAAPMTAQAVQTGGTPPPNPSRFDLYGGYGYLRPVDSDIHNYQYQPINPGAVVSATGYFNRYLGLQAEGNFFPHGPNDCVFGAQAGPVIRYPKNRFVPFAHFLVGGAKVGGPVFQPCTWGWGVTSGVGFDYIVPAFNNHLAIRPIQADFAFSQVQYGPLVLPGGVSGGTGDIYAYRLSAGIVLRLGATSVPPPVQFGCTIQPVDVFPGDPVTVTGTATNLNAKQKATYTWSATGGQVAGNNETATIATAGLAAGDYTVKGHVSQGIRPGQQADCTAGFRIHAYEPPTLSCSANPSTVLSGENSTITAVGHSPQNRPLTYSYSASSGTISGNGTTATLNTAGDTPGTVTVTCNVVDDLGKQATATTSVGITAPPPPPVPPAPSTRSLCSVSFDRDRKRPVRVDNEAKGCLDDIALTLNRESSARLVIVGHHGEDEQPDAAAQRTLNVEQYLIDEKGIDPSRIELRTGGPAGRSVDDILVPAGATFDTTSTATFDSSTVKRTGQPYAKPGAPKSTKKIRTKAN